MNGSIFSQERIWVLKHIQHFLLFFYLNPKSNSINFSASFFPDSLVKFLYTILVVISRSTIPQLLTSPNCGNLAIFLIMGDLGSK